MYRLEEKTVRQVENRLNNSIPWEVVSGTKRPVTNGVPQDQKRVWCCLTSSLMIWMMGRDHLSKFPEQKMPRRAVGVPEACAAIQRNRSRLEKWAERNLMEHQKWNVKSFLRWQKISFAEMHIFQGDFACFLALNADFKKLDLRKINVFSIPLPKTHYKLSTSCKNMYLCTYGCINAETKMNLPMCITMFKYTQTSIHTYIERQIFLGRCLCVHLYIQRLIES